MVGFGPVWCGGVRFGVVRYGVARCYTVVQGAVWFGPVRSGWLWLGPVGLGLTKCSDVDTFSERDKMDGCFLK